MVEIPEADAVVGRRRAQHRARNAVAGAVAVVVLGGGVAFAVANTSGSPKGETTHQPTVTTVPTTPAPHAKLELRLVLNTTPRAQCPTMKNGSPGSEVLTDNTKTVCYVLGPTIMAEDTASAVAVMNPNAEWQVNVTFTNDDFLNKVAKPYVGHEVAVVVDNVVYSAPKIDAGITGRDVTIAGTFTEAEARKLAALLQPGSSTPASIAAPRRPRRPRCSPAPRRRGPRRRSSSRRHRSAR